MSFRPIRTTLLVSLLLIGLLNLWRPCFFLTDDSLTGWLPVFVESARKLWTGHYPFLSDSLFGGGYDFMKDATCFSFLSPFGLLASPLAFTSYYWLIPDIVSSLTALTIAGAFCWAGLRLRRKFNLAISDGMLVLVSVSYAFSPLVLLLSASWITFVSPQACFPIVLAALFEEKAKRAILLISGALLFAIYGGHLHPFIFANIFLWLLVGFVAWQQRSWAPVWKLAAGSALALVLMLPVLIPTMSGFLSSPRNTMNPLEASMALNVPLPKLLLSLALGPISVPIQPGILTFMGDPSFNTALAFSAINIPLLWTLLKKRQWRRIEMGFVVCALVAGVLVIRPLWLGQALHQVPFLRSLRWPFREIAEISFLLHSLALFNFRSFREPTDRIANVVGIAAVLPLAFGAPPTFNEMSIDRELIANHASETFWKNIARQHGRTPHIVVGAPVILDYGPESHLIPYSLLGAYNYAPLLGVVNISGYSPTVVPTANSVGFSPAHHGGIFLPRHAAAIHAAHPDIMLVMLWRVNPSIVQIMDEHRERWFLYDQAGSHITEIPRPADMPSFEELFGNSAQPANNNHPVSK